MKRIAIVGPESTGKSTLCAQLSEYFNSPWVAEYARDYIGALQRPYTYEDVEAIAQAKCKELQWTPSEPSPFIFYDTELIITKVWFLHHYYRMPIWMERAIEEMPIAHYLLCLPDLPWVDDPLRENPTIRQELFLWYKKEIEALGIPYTIVQGVGKERLQGAITALTEIQEEL